MWGWKLKFKTVHSDGLLLSNFSFYLIIPVPFFLKFKVTISYIFFWGLECVLIFSLSVNQDPHVWITRVAFKWYLFLLCHDQLQVIILRVKISAGQPNSQYPNNTILGIQNGEKRVHPNHQFGASNCSSLPSHKHIDPQNKERSNKDRVE